MTLLQIRPVSNSSVQTHVGQTLYQDHDMVTFHYLKLHVLGL